MNSFIFIEPWVMITEPRLLEDIREPLSIHSGVIELKVDEIGKPLKELLGAPRQFIFNQNYNQYVYDEQPFARLGADKVTSAISAFLEGGGCVTTEQGFISVAKHAAFHIKSFKFAVLEAFISIETVVADFVVRKKTERGVSKSKLDEYKNEVGISYMLNVEMPMFVDDITPGDRQILGEADRVRKTRNDIVHEGYVATERDARFAVQAAQRLHEAMRRWASE